MDNQININRLTMEMDMSRNRQITLENVGKDEDTDDLQRSCTDQSVELRKAKGDEQLSKRQNIDTGELDNSASHLQEDVNSGGQGQAHPQAVVNDEETLEEIVVDIFSDDPERQFRSTQLTRKILSRERHPPIDDVIKAGIVPRIVEFLGDGHDPDLQFEAAWVVTNITSGNRVQTNIVVDAGAVEPLIGMLRSPCTNISEQAIWALGNIAGDGPDLRDLVISKGIIPPIVELTMSSNSPSLLQNVAWTLSNLCRGKSPPPPQEAINLCLPALARLVGMTNIEILSNACWALAYLSEGADERIEEVVKSGVIPRLVELLDDETYVVVMPCLRAVGNIVTGTDSQTQSVLDSGVLPTLKKLLIWPNGKIVKEAAWTLSNIAAGTIEQISEVISAGIIPPLIDVLRTGEFRAQMEAIWVITNITTGGNAEHAIYLFENGVIPAMCGMLKCRDTPIILTTLDGMQSILVAAMVENQVEKVAAAIEECGGLDLIEELQGHENTSIYQKAFDILDEFFSED